MVTRHLTFSLQDEHGKPVVSFAAELTIEANGPHSWLVRDSFDASCGIAETPHEAFTDWLTDRLELERLL